LCCSDALGVTIPPQAYDVISRLPATLDFRSCYVAWCGSVAAHAIVEEVIESNLRHLDLRVTRGKSVAAEEPSGWDNERPTIQPYSIFTDQLAAKAHSIPAPTSQPLLVLLSRMVTEAPVVALVIVPLLLPTQPPPALP
jgi:hypothetical protein